MLSALFWQDQETSNLAKDRKGPCRNENTCSGEWESLISVCTGLSRQGLEMLENTTVHLWLDTKGDSRDLQKESQPPQPEALSILA